MDPGPLPEALADPSQRASLEARIAAAEALGADDPRLDASARVPAGRFSMGSGPDEGGPPERPRREVELSAYAIDLVPVTVARFAPFVERGYRERAWWSEAGWAWREATGCERPRFWGEPGWETFLRPSHPVVGVSWYEAEAFARFAGRRLATEAEWERAARGEDGRVYPWGDPFDPGRAAHRGGPRHTLPVGCFPAGRSPHGLWDAAGNVWEWIADWYAEDGYGSTRVAVDPAGPPEGTLKAARGGSWNALPPQLRCAARNAWPPGSRYSNIGFRTVEAITR